MANLDFLNKQDVVSAEPDSYDQIPEGDYTVKIVDSEMRAAKSGNGEYLRLTLEILSPGQTGRKLFHNLNLIHDNPEAQSIAYKELAKICDICGVNRNLNDSQLLHNKAFTITAYIDGTFTNCKNFRPAYQVTQNVGASVQQTAPQGTPPPGWPGK